MQPLLVPLLASVDCT